MSDLNEDLLNYELGEELDDPTLADEDELLLSDEELEKDVSSEQKAMLKDEAEKWVSSKLKTRRTSNKENTKKIEDVVTTSSSSCSEEISTKRNVNNLKKNANVQSQAESDVSTSEELPPPPIKKQQIEEDNANNDNDKTLPESSENDRDQTKNDEVTSTNKEIEDQSVSQTIDKPIQQAKKEELIQSSQEQSSVVVEGEEIVSDPREDPEERAERTNIKHTNERDEHNESPEKYQPGKFFLSKRGRGGSIMRAIHFPGSRAPVRYPHLQYPSYTPQPNENSNSQSQFPYQPVDPQLGPRQPFLAPNQIPPRMEFRPPIGQNYRPQNPNEFMYRGPRPDYASQVNGAPYYGPPLPVRPVFRQDGNVSMNAQGPIRHRMPLPPRPPGIPPQNQIQGYLVPPNSSQPHPMPNTNHPGNFTILATVQSPGQGGVTQPVIPRKVLINPNFKGGVEAATNQLMKDTQFMQAISSHAIHLQSDEELLRQQEEFIKKNRMHIEKRRYERSPGRSRSRERSYSPPRRDRRGNSRERRCGSPRGRTRRASREPENRFPKRRRSASFERRREREKFEEEEDEETRAYRQEIEKQKAMREKILRDKEMRRRKAAEGKQVDEKTPTDEPPAKLKPIIVTESKIISLKKKQTADSATQSTNNSKSSSQQSQSSQPQKQQAIQKTIPTAKILPEAKRSKIDQHQSQHYNVKDASTTTLNTTAMAVIKPVIKKTTSVQADIATNIDNKDDEDESFDEDLLLADTPSPPLSPPSSPPSPVIKTKSSSLSTKNSLSNSNSTTNSSSIGSSGFSSSNRRVVLKSSSKTTRNTAAIQDQDTSMDINRKPIFDRLERKIAVNESVKRKIQRIVIKNAE